MGRILSAIHCHRYRVRGVSRRLVSHRGKVPGFRVASMGDSGRLTTPRRRRRDWRERRNGDRPSPLPSRAAYGTANDDAASSEKLSSPKTPEFKQSEKERIRLAQEERERVVTEKIRAEFEKENEERKKRFEQELDALKKEREAFEAMKKEEDRKRKEKRERKERELKRAKEEKEMENKLSQAKKDATAAREKSRERRRNACLANRRK